MGRVFLTSTFKTHQQQSARKAESKLSYHLADKLVARKLLATSHGIKPFILSSFIGCLFSGTALPPSEFLLRDGTIAVLHDLLLKIANKASVSEV